jgi:uncharacterized protein
MSHIIADTGALAVLLDRADRHHAWAVNCFKKLHSPLHTCEGVLAETLDLLADLPASCQALAQPHEEKILIASFDFESQVTAIWKLLKKYQDQPMDFADACLVRMSELQENSQLWTVDSDFRFYRRNSRHSIPMICP